MKIPSSRRTFLKLSSGLALAAPLGALATPVDGAVIEDARIRLEFDGQLRSRVGLIKDGQPLWLTGFDPSERLSVIGADDVALFTLRNQSSEEIGDRHGPGREMRLVGVSAEGFEKTLTLRQYRRYPGLVILQVSYRNTTQKTLAIGGWSNGAHRLLPATFWSYSGGTYGDRRNWLQPVTQGFAQDNFLGMESSDYGGGPPIADLWRREGGLAVGHLAPVPKLVSLPVREDKGGASLALTFEKDSVLAPGQTLETLESFITAHPGDYFTALDTYRRIAADRG